MLVIRKIVLWGQFVSMKQQNKNSFPICNRGNNGLYHPLNLLEVQRMATRAFQPLRPCLLQYSGFNSPNDISFGKLQQLRIRELSPCIYSAASSIDSFRGSLEVQNELKVFHEERFSIASTRSSLSNFLHSFKFQRQGLYSLYFPNLTTFVFRTTKPDNPSSCLTTNTHWSA